MISFYEIKAAMENIVLQCSLAVDNVLFSFITFVHL